MTLTPEQKATGWIEWNGGECPIKDPRTVAAVQQAHGGHHVDEGWDQPEFWHDEVTAYRIIEAHGADAEPARPTPWPQGMADLVYDADGMSQPFLTDGNWPEWLPEDTSWQNNVCSFEWEGRSAFDGEFAIRVRRREPKSETVRCWVKVTYEGNGPYETGKATIDLIDGKPDLSTLKITEGAL